jgi:two-component system response regulator FixJ
VDDDESVRRSMDRILRAEGYAVALYASGTEFLDSLERQTPACVLMDGQLPDMHGRDVLARLGARAAGVPAIVVTGHDTPEYRRAAAAYGAVAFFTKPFDPDALLAAIRTAVGGGA